VAAVGCAFFLLVPLSRGNRGYQQMNEPYYRAVRPRWQDRGVWRVGGIRPKMVKICKKVIASRGLDDYYNKFDDKG
jgi:hypothetical protein